LDSLKHKYRFMLALSQATTERLLTEALEEAGGRVERGVRLGSCRNRESGVEAILKRADGTDEKVVCPWLLGADGAHSTARSSLQLDFKGSNFDKPWYLADVPLETALDEQAGHAFFLKGGGFVFMIRVVEDAARESAGPKLWRVISDLPNPAERIPEGKAVRPPVWASEFHISHRLSEHLQVGNVYLAGDAAHLHSPLGARGMNLGVEDAWAFSRLVQLGRIGEYEGFRKACDGGVVKRVELLSRMVISGSSLARALRALFLRWLPKVAFLRSRFLATATGLDHDLGLQDDGRAKMPTRGELVNR
jgi:2-polyprenyl-6-methoxyphenol hydroxylase-like FAD-dependent oxidoreductase